MNDYSPKGPRISKVVIVGGGTAGWMTAAALAKVLGRQHYKIQLVESDHIGTVGVGEATIPSILNYHAILQLDEQEFMRKTHATFKMGIEFVNWGKLNHRYMHPFGAYGLNIDSLHFYNYWLRQLHRGKSLDIGEYSVTAEASRRHKFIKPLNVPNTPLSQIKYAYHLDAGLYAKYLRGYAEQRGVERTEGEVINVNLNPDNGFIQSIQLKNGAIIAADLFIDCSGFSGVLIEQALKTGYEDWGHMLLCDSAVTVPTQSVGEPAPFTRSTAHEAGWQWRIPLQHRTGNGHVYASRFMDDGRAQDTLLQHIEGQPLADPKLIRYKTGMRRKCWNKNCIAIGLSSGFLEPLESTSIHLIQKSIAVLLEYFPSGEFNQVDIDKYNDRMRTDVQSIRDFIVLHYKVSSRDDSEFWRHCRAMDVPETLARKIEHYAKSGRLTRDNNELFTEESWIAVMHGQGLYAQDYNPLADLLSDDEIDKIMFDLRSAITNAVSAIPSHSDFIKEYCAV